MALTDREHDLITEIGALMDGFSEVVGHGPTRDNDIREIVAHVHALQQAVMAQSAAREYPDLYRRLGSEIGGDDERH